MDIVWGILAFILVIAASIVFGIVKEMFKAGVVKMANDAQDRSARERPYGSESIDNLERMILYEDHDLRTWQNLKEELDRRHGPVVARLSDYVQKKMQKY